jgi:hypothetical protein
LEHVSVDRQVDRDSHRLTGNRDPTTDDRGEMNDEIEAGVVGGEEPATIAAILQVDTTDGVAGVGQVAQHVAADEPGMTRD